jgi:hypothetical protein
MSISLIGSLLLIITKIISRKIIQRIPQSNILPQLAINQVESFQMTTFHSTARIIQVKPISKNDTGDLFWLFCLFTKNRLPLCSVYQSSTKTCKQFNTRCKKKM